MDSVYWEINLILLCCTYWAMQELNLLATMADFHSLSCYIVGGVVGMTRPSGLQADGLEITEVQSVDAA